MGRDAVPQLVQDVFDLPSYDVLRGGKVNLKAVPRLFLSDYIFTDNVAPVGEPLLSKDQRDCPKDSRAPPRRVLPTPLHRQGGRGAPTPLLGTKHAHPGPCRHVAQLSAVHFVFERQGKCYMIIYIDMT